MAFSVKVTYQGDMYCNINYIAGNYNVTTSVNLKDYFSPVDLLAGALSSCTVSMIASTIESKNLPVNARNVSMETEVLSANHKVNGFKTVIKITDSGKLSDKDKAVIEAAAKSCPVKAALSPDLDIEYTYRYE
jgi:uncharacterized OsmC-like protein